MGGCFSDLKAGQAAVGGPLPMLAAGHNDAVDHFYRKKGYQPLFTQIEVLLNLII